MVLNSEEQFIQAIKKSQRALILISKQADGDIISAALSLYNFLKQNNNQPIIIFPNWKKNLLFQKFSFLPQPKNIQDKLIGAQDFVLSFNTTHKKIINVKTEEKENELKIYITPEHGSINPKDFSFVPSYFHYDLIITIGIPDKESLGEIYENNPDIFYEIPIVNIDYHSQNDNFGQINLINITSSSNSEIIYSFLKKYFPEKINETITNLLLSGIILATNSFQKKNTNPRTLQISAELIEKGADQQKIIRHFYKTQPLSLLKLWGKAMSQLKYDQKLKLVWITLKLEDFIQTRTQPAYLPEVLFKIQNNYSDGKIFLAIYQERIDAFKLILCANDQILLKQISDSTNFQFQIENDLITGTITADNLIQAEKKSLEIIKKSLIKD